MSHNKLTGHLPESWSKLTSLVSLKLHYNELDGPLPMVITRLPCVRLVSLSHCKFTGTVPREYRGIRTLLTLDLRSNAAEEADLKKSEETVAQHLKRVEVKLREVCIATRPDQTRQISATECTYN